MSESSTERQTIKILPQLWKALKHHSNEQRVPLYKALGNILAEKLGLETPYKGKDNLFKSAR